MLVLQVRSKGNGLLLARCFAVLGRAGCFIVAGRYAIRGNAHVFLGSSSGARLRGIGSVGLGLVIDCLVGAPLLAPIFPSLRANSPDSRGLLGACVNGVYAPCLLRSCSTCCCLRLRVARRTMHRAGEVGIGVGPCIASSGLPTRVPKVWAGAITVGLPGGEVSWGSLRLREVGSSMRCRLGGSPSARMVSGVIVVLSAGGRVTVGLALRVGVAFLLGFVVEVVVGRRLRSLADAVQERCLALANLVLGRHALLTRPLEGLAVGLVRVIGSSFIRVVTV